ncbi:MAG: phage holin family protein [Desulfobacteraceae bacterium]|nr:phage holin family protein [Desulfobacteraceae bacterium]
MWHDLKETVDVFMSLMPVVVLSAVGGAVAYLNDQGKNFSWFFFLIGIVTAGFVGVVVHFLLLSTGFSPGLKSAAIAISGYASREVLGVLKNRILRKVL